MRSAAFNAGEFFLVVLRRQVDPAEKIRAGARFVVQLLVRQPDGLGHIIEFMLSEKPSALL